MLAWIVEHNRPLVIILWIVSSIIAVIYAWAFISDWHYKKRFRRQLRMGAVLQARYSVLNSWVLAGGGAHDLSDHIAKSMLDDNDAQARRNGDEYYELYQLSQRDAQRDLQAALTAYEGKIRKEQTHDQKD